jgi:RNA exonuclease 4
MAELSSNWKKLQAKLKAESGSTTSSKRKRELAPNESNKKSKPTKKSIPALTKGSSKQKPMGAVHSSSKSEHVSPNAITPSLALWAEDNDISSEKIAEAYELGVKDHKLSLAAHKDRINHGLSEGLDIGKYIAVDCEMVGVGPGGHESALARISIVDFHGTQVYDSYVKPKERVTNWRTQFSGISPKEMRFARDFEEVQEEVADLMSDRIVVGHDLKHDLDALKLSHPNKDIRDTAKYVPFKKFGHGRRPALRTLAQEILGVEIQSGAHSSIEDARVTMLLFRKHKSGFDVDHANRYAPKVTHSSGPSKGKKPKKKRK